MGSMTATAQLARERVVNVLAKDRVEARPVSGVLMPKAGAHEATRSTRQRKLDVDGGSGNRIVGMDALQLRSSARALCRDYDVARSALSVLVQNTVGSGIDVMPAPRIRGGEVDREIAQQLRDLWDAWWDRPEVTWQHDFGKVQQLLAAAWFRDGEAFWQQLLGPVDFLDHGTDVPLSIELLEADLVPLDLNDKSRGILQGVERNAWGRVVAYHVYKQHPGDGDAYRIETKRVPAEQMRHLAQIDRIHQVRGLTVFASVVNRLRDIQDYENSERVAAKVAASYCAQIIKDASLLEGMSPDAGAALDTVYRSLSMVPGMIGDDLQPGEKLEIIDSKRPNPNIDTYLNGQLRRFAGGVGASFSSVSLNYNGTYSAQRQELVEKYGGYAMLGEQFVARVLRPVWQDFVRGAVLAGKVRMPKGWTLRELSAAVFIRPQMPWIDPLKEVLAMGERVDRGWMADQQAITQSGNDPEEVARLRDDWAAQGRALPAPSRQPSDTQDADARRESLVRAAVMETT